MKTLRILLANLAFLLMPAVELPAEEAPPLPYDQKLDVVYGETHGTGLLMDVFTPKGKTNGLGIIDVVSGAISFPCIPWFSAALSESVCFLHAFGLR
jgi:hypothetical protein